MSGEQFVASLRGSAASHSAQRYGARAGFDEQIKNEALLNQKKKKKIHFQCNFCCVIHPCLSFIHLPFLKNVELNHLLVSLSLSELNPLLVSLSLSHTPAEFVWTIDTGHARSAQRTGQDDTCVYSSRSERRPPHM